MRKAATVLLIAGACAGAGQAAPAYRVGVPCDGDRSVAAQHPATGAEVHIYYLPGGGLGSLAEPCRYWGDAAGVSVQVDWVQGAWQVRDLPPGAPADPEMWFSLTETSSGRRVLVRSPWDATGANRLGQWTSMRLEAAGPRWSEGPPVDSRIKRLLARAVLSHRLGFPLGSTARSAGEIDFDETLNDPLQSTQQLALRHSTRAAMEDLLGEPLPGAGARPTAFQPARASDPALVTVAEDLLKNLIAVFARESARIKGEGLAWPRAVWERRLARERRADSARRPFLLLPEHLEVAAASLDELAKRHPDAASAWWLKVKLSEYALHHPEDKVSGRARRNWASEAQAALVQLFRVKQWPAPSSTLLARLKTAATEHEWELRRAVEIGERIKRRTFDPQALGHGGKPYVLRDLASLLERESD